jgi:thiol-disulfide isomerase/thioredoxin
MRRGIFFMVIFFLCTQSGFVQELNRRIFDDGAGQEILMDEINRQGLRQEPFASWFTEGYNEYQPDSEILEQLLAQDLSYIKIILVLGTWCGDSKREVPHFFKILDEITFPEENLQMIAVNRSKESETFSLEELGITHVPTFIIINDGFETGRIVEFPEESLEKDLFKILSK